LEKALKNGWYFSLTPLPYRFVSNFFDKSSSSYSIIDLADESIESSISSSRLTAPAKIVPVVFYFLYESPSDSVAFLSEDLKVIALAVNVAF